MRRSLPTTAVLAALALSSTAVAATAGAATTKKPALGKACTAVQVGTVSGSLVCVKSGKAGVWKKAPATTTTVATAPPDPLTAAPGTVLAQETFDNPAASTWHATGGNGWTGETRDGVYRIAAAPPAPGRIGIDDVFNGGPKAEWAFDMTLTPGAASLASPNLTCLDSGATDAPYNFLLIDIRTDGRLVALRYDNAAATQAPDRFFDLGFSNQNRFDKNLLHPKTRVSLRCMREGTDVHVVLTLDSTVVMDTTTKAPTGAGGGFTLYLATFTSGFRDAAELLIDNAVLTKR